MIAVVVELGQPGSTLNRGPALAQCAEKRKVVHVSSRALNRALLQRQRLLRRSTGRAEDTIAHLVGMQSQAP